MTKKKKTSKEKLIDKHKNDNEFKNLMDQLKSSFIGESECELI